MIKIKGQEREKDIEGYVQKQSGKEEKGMCQVANLSRSLEELAD